MEFTETDLEIVKCDLCNAGYADSELWAKKDGINIVKCIKCGLVYSNPRFNESALNRYYSETYFKEGNYEEDEQRLESYQFEIKEIISIVGSSGKFLDVGAAYGRFLNELPNTFEKHGLEFSKDAVEFGKKKYNLSLEQGSLPKSKYTPGSFDIVHFRGVFEHLREPTKNVQKSREILKENGWLIISTLPNIDGPVGKVYKEKFRLVFPQEHIYYFSTKTITQLLEKNGFEIKKITYPYIETPYANPVKDTVGFIVNRIIGKESPPFWKNILTVYAKKI